MGQPLSRARRLGAALVLVSAAAARAQSPSPPLAAGRPTTLAATRGSITGLRAVEQVVDAMIRDHALVRRDVERDALLPDRNHERMDQ